MQLISRLDANASLFHSICLGHDHDRFACVATNMQDLFRIGLPVTVGNAHRLLRIGAAFRFQRHHYRCHEQSIWVDWIPYSSLPRGPVGSSSSIDQNNIAQICIFIFSTLYALGRKVSASMPTLQWVTVWELELSVLKSVCSSRSLGLAFSAPILRTPKVWLRMQPPRRIQVTLPS